MSDIQKRLEAAGRAGDAGAAHELARRLDAGDDVSQDAAEALRWYEIAATLGSSSAAFVLGRKFRDGESVAQDEAAALKWFSRAAELGDAAAHMFLASVFSEGLLGQQPDPQRARAHVESAQAAAQEDIAHRRKRRDQLKKALDDEEKSG